MKKQRTIASLYDVDGRDNLRDDIPFYIEYAHEQKSDILELGCGTGRVSLKLAEQGFNVTGLDIDADMLNVFSSKINEENSSRINLVQDNMANFSLDKKYGMIIVPFRSFQALITEKDVTSFFQSVKKHLNEHGIFILNVFNPNEQMLRCCGCENVLWKKVDYNLREKITKKNICEKVDTEQQTICTKYIYEIFSSDGSVEMVSNRVMARYYYYEQIVALVKDMGLDITEEYSWYDKTPIGGREIILVCQKH